MKRKIGKASLVLAIIAIVWLLLGMLDIVPLGFELSNETTVRSHASLAVLFLLIGSWAFWDED